MGKSLAAPAAPSAKMLIPETISLAETHRLSAYKDALAWTAKADQVAQFSRLHKEGGLWAYERGFQPHARWLEAAGSDQPLSFMEIKNEPVAPRMTAWLLAQGWAPDAQRFSRLLFHCLFSDVAQKIDLGVNIQGINNYSQDDRVAIVDAVVQELDGYERKGQDAHVASFLDSLPDTLINAANYHPLSPRMTQMWKERSTRAQRDTLSIQTPGTQGYRRQNRI